MSPSEQRLYHSQSPWTITSCGHFRSAIVTGMAARMPSFFAGIDAAAMMLRRSPGSPETTDGTSRMSWPPSRTIFTAVQLRKAEFTSIWKMTRGMTAAGRLFGGGLRGLHPVPAVLEGDLVQREDPRHAGCSSKTDNSFGSWPTSPMAMGLPPPNSTSSSWCDCL